MLGQTKNAVGGCQSAIRLICLTRPILKSFSVPRPLCVLCDSVAKYEFAALAHKILNPFQPTPKLFKPFQDPREGGRSVIRPKSLRRARARWTQAKLNLGKFSLVKVILGKLRLFQEKKDCLFFLSRRLVSSKSDEGGLGQTNPKSKSTAGSRKSTVDSGCDLLIWGKNDLPTSALPACRHPFHPLMTRKSYRANQKQTEANQKIDASTLDLGCEENVGGKNGDSPNLML